MFTYNFSFTKDAMNSYIDFESQDYINTILMESIAITHIFDKTVLINGTQLVFSTTNVLNLYDLIENKHKFFTYSYSFLLKMIYDLSIQLKFLIKTHKKCYIGFSPKDIFIINNEHFFCINKKNLLDTKDHTILINYPIELEDFFYAPELKIINEIPSCIDYNCSYYSLGLILVYITNPDNFKNDHNHVMDYLNHINLRNTDLYYLLRRCLQLESSRRSIIYI